MVAWQGRKKGTSEVWGSGGCGALGWHCWGHPVPEGEGIPLESGTAKALRASPGAAGATSTRRKGLAGPCSGGSHLEIVLRCCSRPVGVSRSRARHNEIVGPGLVSADSAPLLPRPPRPCRYFSQFPAVLTRLPPPKISVSLSPPRHPAGTAALRLRSRGQRASSTPSIIPDGYRKRFPEE